MYKWVVQGDSTIEYVGDPKKKGEENKKGDEVKATNDGKVSGNLNNGRSFRASRRKGRLPPMKKVKVELPSSEDDETSDEDEMIVKKVDKTKESSQVCSKDIVDAVNTKKEIPVGKSDDGEQMLTVKEEPASEENLYGVMPSNAAASKSYDDSDTDSMTSRSNSQCTDLGDQSDSVCDLSTGRREPQSQSLQTTNNVTIAPQPTMPVVNGITANVVTVNPNMLQSGGPIFVAAVPTLQPQIMPQVTVVDGSNPLNIIASTAALASRADVRGSADSSGSEQTSVNGDGLPKSSRKRADKQPVPDEAKDTRYFERRRRNNLAAKRSRDARRAREEDMSVRIAQLEQENAILRSQLAAAREKAETLRRDLEPPTQP
ncbi:uncharacterized protein LOC144445726 [Glandiceps talaboti]